MTTPNPFDQLLAKIAAQTQQGDLAGAALTLDETLAEIDRLGKLFRDELHKLHDYRVKRLLAGIDVKVQQRRKR